MLGVILQLVGGARMKWAIDTIRCVRRFAFFPTCIYDSDISDRIFIWLEPYHAIQTRDNYGNVYSRWRNLRLASKEEYIEWNKKEKD